MKNIFLLSFLVIFSLSSQTYSWAESPKVSNRVVAFVNNDVITLYELDKKILEMTGRNATQLEQSNKEKFDGLRRKVLQLLIDQKITREKIKELGIHVTEKEVDAALEHMKRVNGMTQDDLANQLKERKIDYSKYRELIKSDLERFRLVNLEVKSKIIVREEEINAYYEKNINEYKIPGKIRLAGIFFSQKDPSDQAEKDAIIKNAREIADRLKKGEDFASLAREFSVGPGADEGGDLGSFEISQLSPEIREAVKGLSPGDITEPIVGDTSVQILKIIERKQGRTKPLEEVREAIHDVLYKEKIDVVYSSWIKELRNKSYTKIIL